MLLLPAAVTGLAGLVLGLGTLLLPTVCVQHASQVRSALLTTALMRPRPGPLVLVQGLPLDQ